MDTYNKVIKMEERASLGCCTLIEKFLVWIINFLLFLVGVVQIAAGIWALKNNVVEWTGPGLANACIAMGTIVMFISFLGCCGAWMENRPMLWVYAFLLFVLVLGQAGAISVVAVYGTYAESFMQSMWTNSSYDSLMEDQWKCCSYDGKDAAFATPADHTEYLDCVAEHSGEIGWPADEDIPTCKENATGDVQSLINSILVAEAIAGSIQISILFMTLFLINGIAVKTAVKDEQRYGGGVSAC